MKSVRRTTLARFSLELFYTFMTIYTPIYLHTVLGFEWGVIGLIFAVALLPFVLLQWPAGRLADHFFGEKEMLIIGFLFMGFSLLFMPTLGGVVIIWAVVLFFSRVGASLAETMTDSYFFKHTNAQDVALLSIFRLTRSASVIFGSIIGAIALNFLSFDKIFYVLAIITFFGLKEALLIRDTK
jgi:MFS family permease